MTSNMKKVLLFAMALVCAVSLAASCNKIEEVEDDDELVTFVGDWKYTGIENTGIDDIDFFKYYRFLIDEKEIRIYEMDKTTLTTTLSYTRKGNKVTFTPAFNGKYGSANLRKSYGSSTESMCWDCGNGQGYYFSKF